MVNHQTIILSLPQIKEALKTLNLIPLIERGFVEYSKGNAIIPPVGEIQFEAPPGETHIKYGYIKNQANFVVKIASGFPDNSKLGIPTSQGVMLVFSQKTGQMLAVLLDEGHLTDIRTSIASMISIKHLAPKNMQYIGIIGTGIQAKLQLRDLATISNCKNIVLWGRNNEHCNQFCRAFEETDFNIKIANTPSDLAKQCQVIITTTSSKTPLLQASDIQPGTHITALGSDTPEKIELTPGIIQKAELVVADSFPQSQFRGEIYQARRANCLDDFKLTELGTIINHPEKGRINDKQITIADLTGVAVQDIMIATAVLDHFKSQ